MPPVCNRKTAILHTRDCSRSRGWQSEHRIFNAPGCTQPVATRVQAGRNTRESSQWELMKHRSASCEAMVDQRFTRLPPRVWPSWLGHPEPDSHELPNQGVVRLRTDRKDTLEARVWRTILTQRAWSFTEVFLRVLSYPPIREAGSQGN